MNTIGLHSFKHIQLEQKVSNKSRVSYESPHSPSHTLPTQSRGSPHVKYQPQRVQDFLSCECYCSLIKLSGFQHPSTQSAVPTLFGHPCPLISRALQETLCEGGVWPPLPLLSFAQVLSALPCELQASRGSLESPVVILVQETQEYTCTKALCCPSCFHQNCSPQHWVHYMQIMC